jgi:hypothetical protein
MAQREDELQDALGLAADPRAPVPGRLVSPPAQRGELDPAPLIIADTATGAGSKPAIARKPRDPKGERSDGVG